MRLLLFMLAALIVAGGSGYTLWRGYDAPGEVTLTPVAAPEPARREIYLAATGLDAGTLIAPEHLGRMQVGEAALTPEMIVADEDGTARLVGSVARQVLAAGVPIARSATVQPGERGLLAAVLP